MYSRAYPKYYVANVRVLKVGETEPFSTSLLNLCVEFCVGSGTRKSKRIFYVAQYYESSLTILMEMNNGEHGEKLFAPSEGSSVSERHLF